MEKIPANDKNLLQSKRFLPLLITQFLGALNDNLFKNALLTMVTIKMTAKADILTNIIAGLFILPFFLFSAMAGTIADKYARDKIVRILKIAELILMLGVGCVYYTGNIYILIILLTLMGTQSAFFGPIKYALLPQLLKPKELVEGNAYIEATTYMAILLGLILGTLLPTSAAVIMLIICAGIGVWSARQIPSVAPTRPTAQVPVNIFKSISGIMQLIKRNPIIYKSILGASWFWTVGALVAVQIYPLSGKVLNVSEGCITFFLMVFSLGVALGSLCCSKLLKGLIHATYVPISALGMGLGLYFLYKLTADYSTPATTVDFMHYFSIKNAGSILISLFMLAFCGGLYIVPLNAMMQAHAPSSHTASVIAGNNILNALGMVVAAVYAVIMLALGFNIEHLFLYAAFASLGIFFYISLLLPDALLRSILQTILSILFRVELSGLENLKKAGRRSLLIANHTSLLDGVLIAAFMPEKIMFALNSEWYKKWYIKLFGLLVKFYPIDPSSPIALRQMISEMKKNNKLMIFPEGRITTTGGLMKVYEGAGVIAEKAEAKIVPIRISGAQYSKFSYLNHTLKTRFFPKISIKVLPPCSFNTDETIKGRDRRHATSMKLYDVMVNMMYTTSNINENLFESLINAARINGWNHKIAEDVTRKTLNYRQLIEKSYILGSSFKRRFHTEENIGLMLPNSLANLCCYFALQAIDKVPVMINFSLGLSQIISSVKTVKLKIIFTSKKFIEQARLDEVDKSLKTEGVQIIYLEDYVKEISWIEKLKGFTAYIIGKMPAHTADKTATILFTSGSEGCPKAVLLSHKNLQANRYQLASVIAFNCADIFFNALPMFHSFGLSVGTLLTTLSGVKTFYYPSPLHYRIVPELVYDTNSTIICGTDTFFNGYGRMAHPYDFFNLKYAIVGGEKLKETTSHLWMEKFGIRILEGYGATETSPVLALNTPMYLKKGTVGRLLPGISYKLESISDFSEGGKLIVSGDNIMVGYIKADRPGQIEPPKQKWYDTGDIVSIDDEGFVKILGRVKRFAKIGGEMVSLSAVEGIIEKLYPNMIQGIIAIPDEKKGEQLILVTNNEKANLNEIKTYFKENGFVELWIPKKVIYIPTPPVMGTGKFDYTKAAELVEKELNGNSIGLL